MIYFTVCSDFDSAALDASSVFIFLLFIKNEGAYRCPMVMHHVRKRLGIHPGGPAVNVRQIAQQLRELTKNLRSWFGSDQDIRELLGAASHLDKHDACKEFDHRLKSTHSNDKSGGRDRGFDKQYVPSEEPTQREADTDLTDEEITAV